MNESELLVSEVAQRVVASLELLEQFVGHEGEARQAGVIAQVRPKDLAEPRCS
ncbi:MAG: hypothetical protein U0Q16_14640 [Bryobacteraceae bacterium]